MIEINNAVEAPGKKKDGNCPLYSIKEAAEMTGISAHTLRYYDRVHLFPLLQRDENNVRVFSDSDIDWIRMIECLRKTDLSIQEIKHYVDLNLQGDTTLIERYEIICNQEAVLKQKLTDTQDSLDRLHRKMAYYQGRLREAGLVSSRCCEIK